MHHEIEILNQTMTFK